MADIEVYLPTELHQQPIRLKLDPPQVPQNAIRGATGRDHRRASAREFLAWMDDGPPLSAEEVADGEARRERIIPAKNR